MATNEVVGSVSDLWRSPSKSMGGERHEEAKMSVLPTEGGEARRVTARPAGVAALRWAPGGERIAFLAPDRDPAETEEKEETGDVIEMGVGQKDAAERGHLLEGQITDPASGVDQEVVVDQEGGRPPPATDATAGTEYPDAHWTASSWFRAGSAPRRAGAARCLIARNGGISKCTLLEARRRSRAGLKSRTALVASPRAD